MITRSGVLVCALALVFLLVAGPAWAAKATAKPRLAVSKVNDPPRNAVAGDRFAVTGRVANRGRRTGKGWVRLYLNDRRQRAGALAIGSKRVRARAGRSTPFSAAGIVPTIGRLEPGDYALIACIRQRGGSKGAVRCRSAGSKVIVSPPGTPPATPPTPPSGPGSPVHARSDDPGGLSRDRWERALYNLARALQSGFAYGNVSTREFIDLAKDMSGLSGAKLTLLEDYFQQWLYGEQKPTITPDSFN